MKEHKGKDAGKTSGINSKYEGAENTVVHCEGALESFWLTLSKVDTRKRRALTRGMILQIERLASGQRMSREHFTPEGTLPGTKGGTTPQKFYALKRIPIRGYCWKSHKYEKTWFISHYIFKDYQKLKEKDVKKVHEKWYKIEGKR